PRAVCRTAPRTGSESCGKRALRNTIARLRASAPASAHADRRLLEVGLDELRQPRLPSRRGARRVVRAATPGEGKPPAQFGPFEDLRRGVRLLTLGRCRRWALVLMLMSARPSLAQPPFKNDSDPFLFAGHVAQGFGAHSPYVFGQVGVRIWEKHVLLG